MLNRLLLAFSSLILMVFLSSCTLPRGAPIQSEIIHKSRTATPDLAIYPVTKGFLPTVAQWPTTGTISAGRWISHRHSGSGTTIASGDSLDLVLWDNEDNSLLTSPEQKVTEIKNIRVSPDGTIFVPYIEKIKVSGLSQEQARIKVQTELESIVPSAQVQLTVTAGTNRSISLIGGVASPGTYPIMDAHFTVLNLISAGGGVSTSLRNPHVRLIRAGRTYSTSLKGIFKSPARDTILRGGDKVIVESDERYFRSLGAAAKEQLVYFEEDKISALDAIALIGGISDTRANPKGILVLREYPSKTVRTDGTGPENERVVFTIDLTTSDGLFSAGKFTINSEDTVLVTESALNSVNTIFGLIGRVFGLANQVD